MLMEMKHVSCPHMNCRSDARVNTNHACFVNPMFSIN